MKFFNKERNFILLLLLIAIMFITFFSTSTSPLYGTGDFDSCGYILMGMELAEGRVPYLTISDNKGPVLWLIEGIGQFLIKGKTGVYLIQCCFMFLSLLFITKAVKELFNISKIKQFICCLVYLTTIASMYMGGNLTEEFSLFFIIMSLYVVTLFINKKISYFKIGLVLSIDIMCVVFIRINDSLSIIYMWILVLLTVLFNNKDKLKSLKAFLFGNLSGFLLVCVPIIVFYGINHALFNIIDDYFVIGMGYARNNLNLMDGIVQRTRLLFATSYGNVLLTSFIFTIVSICVYYYSKESKNKLIIPLIIGINISVIIAAIIKPKEYAHYLMPVSISYLLATALFLNIYQILSKEFWKRKEIVFVLFTLSIILINANLIGYMFSNFKSIILYDIILKNNYKVDNAYKELAEVIPDEEKNNGLAFRSPKWYLVTGTRPFIKYIWTDTLVYNEKELDAFLEYLKENPPKWLFITDEKELYLLGEEAYNFFNENYIKEKENSIGKIYFYVTEY